MPLVRRSLSAALHVTAGWARDRASSWAVTSQRRSRRNAMLAATTLARRRVDAAEAAGDTRGRTTDAPGRTAHG